MITTSPSAGFSIAGGGTAVSAVQSARALFGYRKKDILAARAIVLTRPDSFLSDWANDMSGLEIGQGYAQYSIPVAILLNILVWHADLEAHVFRFWGTAFCPLFSVAVVLAWGTLCDIEYQKTSRMVKKTHFYRSSLRIGAPAAPFIIILLHAGRKLFLRRIDS